MIYKNCKSKFDNWFKIDFWFQWFIPTLVIKIRNETCKMAIKVSTEVQIVNWKNKFNKVTSDLLTNTEINHTNKIKSF